MARGQEGDSGGGQGGGGKKKPAKKKAKAPMEFTLNASLD